jgi:hypothetical protein
VGEAVDEEDGKKQVVLFFVFHFIKINMPFKSQPFDFF